jgi:hypothetical protein
MVAKALVSARLPLMPYPGATAPVAEVGLALSDERPAG